MHYINHHIDFDASPFDYIYVYMPSVIMKVFKSFNNIYS